MKIKCPKCQSENLDQGVNEQILCHDCRVLSWIVPVNEFSNTVRGIEP